MSRASRIVIADADAKHTALLAYGFEREGMAPAPVTHAEDALKAAPEADALVVGLADAGDVQLIRLLRGPGGAAPKVPVVATGDETLRAQALNAGAVDFLPRPAFVRDVVTLTRLAMLGKGAAPSVWQGDLADFAGIFYLVRALTHAQRTGVMTLVKGLRRGELRFYAGEVTSVQSGGLHGMAALHQVLLWTEGKLELRVEPVVRRQQIPLQPDELLGDMARFLRDFGEVAGELRPGMVLEQDLKRVAERVDKIPKEVNPVLRLFDGQRTLADVVEDSPFRVFETVKIAVRLQQLGALRAVESGRARAQSALAVDDWLVGRTPPLGQSSRPPSEDDIGPKPGEPASPPDEVAAAADKKKKKKDRDREPRETPRVENPNAVKPAASDGGKNEEWGRLPAATAGSVWDIPGYAPVVPSQTAGGEIASSVARPAPDANLAQVGKVIAQDLSTAAAAAAAAAASAAPKPAPAPMSIVQEITAEAADTAAAAARAVQEMAQPVSVGKARERIDEISGQHATAAPEPAPAPTPAPAPVAAPIVTIVPAAPAPAAAEPVALAAAPAGAPAPATPDNGVVSGHLTARAAPKAHEEPQSPSVVLVDVGFEEESQPSKPALPQPLLSLTPKQPIPALTDAPHDSVIVHMEADEPDDPPPAAMLAAIAPPVVAPPAVVVAPELVPVLAPPPSVLSSAPPAAPEVPPAAAVAAVAAEVARGAADAALAAARALDFDDIDHEFFNQEHKINNAKPPPVENFTDLDEGYEPPPEPQGGFFQRMFGTRRRRPTTVPPPMGGRPTGQPSAAKPGGQAQGKPGQGKPHGGKPGGQGKKR
jgi:FixJ family two-component response regulator